MKTANNNITIMCQLWLLQAKLFPGFEIRNVLFGLIFIYIFNICG